MHGDILPVKAASLPTPEMVRRNLEHQMKTAALDDRFEDNKPIPPATPAMYHHDSEDNTEEFDTANWREEGTFDVSRKHLICSIAKRSDTMSRSLGQIADEVKAIPQSINQSIAQLRSAIDKSTTATEKTTRSTARVRKLCDELDQLRGTVDGSTTALDAHLERQQQK